jgi:2-succinyl-5-enolpyruvyl-6-hydroxy-3-cyclohexene-1-carboxylate synthase
MTNPPDWPNINYAWSGLLVEELVRLGVSGFVLSPGSRNSPLALSAVQDGGARFWVHFDERGAGFFALGLAKRIGGPVVLLCTSGSAAANYWPAIVEADASGVSLIVITADRPPELLDCGANQAIHQPGLYGRYVRWEAQLPCPTAQIAPAFLLTTVDQAHARSLGPDAGPVHLNFMFREPLAPVPDDSIPTGYLDSLALWRVGSSPYTHIAPVVSQLGEATRAELISTIQTCSSGLLVVGALIDVGETAAAAELARKLGWPVFADACAGLRGHPDLPMLLDYGDLLLLDTALENEWCPTVVIHVGGPVTSKRLQNFIQRVSPRYVRVCPGTDRLDPGHLVSWRISLSVFALLSDLEGDLESRAPGKLPDALAWRNEQCRAVLDAWQAEQNTLSEIGVARLIAEQAPAHSLLFLGNSMPVRLIDSFGVPLHPDVVMAANRGASGIDGNIATAAGMALVSGRPTVALIGDLTALHDLNSLALLRHVKAPFVLVILNNDGGGIFHHLPIVQHENHFEECFGTPHGLNFPAAATLFNVPYRHPVTPGEFSAALNASLLTPGPTLIEVSTNRYASRGVHEALHARLREAMNRRDISRESGLDPIRPVTLAGTPERPPLLLLHGFLGATEDWMAVAQTLGTNFHVLAVNLPGHGPGWRGWAVEAQGMAACAAGIVAGLDAAGIGRLALAGYSMGGRLALYLAVHYPERFTRVVLESASPGLDTPEKRKTRAAQDAALALRLAAMAPRSPEFRAFLEEWYEQPLFATLQQHPETLAILVAKRHAHGSPALLARSIRALGTGVQPDLWPALPEYATPTLLITGEQDRKFSIIAEDMCRACPVMAQEVFSGCGHNVHLENPGAWLTVVRAFLLAN